MRPRPSRLFDSLPSSVSLFRLEGHFCTSRPFALPDEPGWKWFTFTADATRVDRISGISTTCKAIRGFVSEWNDVGHPSTWALAALEKIPHEGRVRPSRLPPNSWSPLSRVRELPRYQATRQARGGCPPNRTEGNSWIRGPLPLLPLRFTRPAVSSKGPSQVLVSQPPGPGPFASRTERLDNVYCKLIYSSAYAHRRHRRPESLLASREAETVPEGCRREVQTLRLLHLDAGAGRAYAAAGNLGSAGQGARHQTLEPAPRERGQGFSESSPVVCPAEVRVDKPPLKALFREKPTAAA